MSQISTWLHYFTHYVQGFAPNEAISLIFPPKIDAHPFLYHGIHLLHAHTHTHTHTHHTHIHTGKYTCVCIYYPPSWSRTGIRKLKYIGQIAAKPLHFKTFFKNGYKGWRKKRRRRRKRRGSRNVAEPSCGSQSLKYLQAIDKVCLHKFVYKFLKDSDQTTPSTQEGLPVIYWLWRSFSSRSIENNFI